MVAVYGYVSVKNGDVKRVLELTRAASVSPEGSVPVSRVEPGQTVIRFRVAHGEPAHDSTIQSRARISELLNTAGIWHVPLGGSASTARAA
ncbi:hypothetical protein BH09ACT6_BH09ACT6_01720 [soil metagenome]